MIIETKNIIKTYILGNTKLNAVNDVSLNINKGEFVAIMGASGSGKSTFMNILGCLDTPTSGDYYLKGINTKSLSKNEQSEIRNTQIGFIFQGFNLLSRTTALENVELPLIYAGIEPDLRIKKAKEALEIVGLQDKLNNMPNQLSGGQQQRVAIARALVNDAPIIFADEPTGNLDTKTSYEIMEFFTTLNQKGKTIVLVTHENDIAKYSKRIIRFQDGNIIEDKLNK